MALPDLLAQGVQRPKTLMDSYLERAASYRKEQMAQQELGMRQQDLASQMEYRKAQTTNMEFEQDLATKKAAKEAQNQQLLDAWAAKGEGLSREEKKAHYIKGADIAASTGDSQLMFGMSNMYSNFLKEEEAAQGPSYAPTGDMQEYSLAQRQGFKGSILDWKEATSSQGEPENPYLQRQREAEAFKDERTAALTTVQDIFRNDMQADYSATTESYNFNGENMSNVVDDTRQFALNNKDGWNAAPQYIRNKYSYVPAESYGWNKYDSGFFIPKVVPSQIVQLSAGKVKNEQAAVDLYYNWVIKHRLSSEAIAQRIAAGKFEEID